MANKYSSYFIAIIIFVCVQQWVEASTSFYLTDLCRKRNVGVIRTSFSGATASGTIYVNRRNETFPSHLNCRVTLRLTKIYQHGIVINAGTHPIAEQYENSTNTFCDDYRMDYIASHHSSHETYTGNNVTRCLTDGPMTFESASSVYMHFHFSNSTRSLNPMEFRINFTNYQRNFCRDRKDFSCANTNCIWKRLVCDGTDNCGDNSDEEQLECEYKRPTTIFGTVWSRPTDMMSLFGLVLACLTLFAVTASAFYLCGKTIRYRQTSNSRTPAKPVTWSNEWPLESVNKPRCAGLTNREFLVADRPPPYTRS